MRVPIDLSARWKPGTYSPERCLTAWIRLDDQIAHHPKFLKAGPIASWLWIGCVGYAQRFLTDGFIPAGAVTTLCNVDRPALYIKRLLLCGLLEQYKNGYLIHDYLNHNASRSEVEADKKWDRFRKELYSDPTLVRAIKVRDANRCRYCAVEVNWNDRRGPTGGQFDHVIPRGPNTLDNIVVACRRCNCSKGNRTQMALNSGLQSSSEPDKNQIKSSSEPDLRARASYPSHPIPSVRTERENKLISSNGDGSDRFEIPHKTIKQEQNDQRRKQHAKPFR